MLQLNRKNLWMVPTSGGLWMFCFWLFLLLGAVNYQNNLGFMMVFLIASVGVLSILISFRNLSSRSLSVAKDQWLFAKTLGALKLNTHSPRDSHQLSLSMLGQSQTWKRASSGSIELNWTPSNRGRVTLDQIEVGSLFPFGWLSVRTRWASPGEVIVFPTPIAAPNSARLGGVGHSVGSQPSDFDLRPYRVGDRLNAVQWKYNRPYRQWLVSAPFASGDVDTIDWRSYNEFPAELAISYMTDRVLNCESREAPYKLVLPGTQLGPDSGEGFLRECLTALALEDLSR